MSREHLIRTTLENIIGVWLISQGTERNGQVSVSDSAPPPQWREVGVEDQRKLIGQVEFVWCGGGWEEGLGDLKTVKLII